MSDFITGIKNVPPTFPVKPVQPGSKDRKSGERQKERPKPETGSEPESDDDRPGDSPTVDEYV